MTALLAKLWAFLSSKGGALLAGALAVVAAAAAIFARGRKQGELEQRVAQEDREDAARADLAKSEAQAIEANVKRQAELTSKLRSIESDVPKHPKTAKDALAEAQASKVRAKLVRTRMK